jgi:hypothetical protein
MPLATLTLELAIEHAQSLKDRRQCVRSLKEKLRHGFNISIARRIATGLGCEILEAVLESDVSLDDESGQEWSGPENESQK